MIILGIIAGILSLLGSVFYGWQLTVILILFYVSLKTDTVLLVEDKLKQLFSDVSE